MKKTITTLLLIFVCFNSYSQETPRSIANKFFEIYTSRDTDKALDYLFSNSPYKNEIANEIEDVKQKLRKTAEQVGGFYGADFLWARRAGTNLIMLTYLVRHDRQPLTFHLLFYKPFDKWRLQNFKYNNSIDEQLEEASKAYRQMENYP